MRAALFRHRNYNLREVNELHEIYGNFPISEYVEEELIMDNDASDERCAIMIRYFRKVTSEERIFTQPLVLKVNGSLSGKTSR